MHRFYIRNPVIREGLITFVGSEWHHCKTVLRAGRGDLVTLFDGKGTEYLTEIKASASKEAQLKILTQNTLPPPPYAITLAQALPKNKAIDWIIQKATELGVREIIPTLSERSVIRWDPQEIASKLNRWEEITIEAAKQCGLHWLPRFTPPQTVKEVTRQRPSFSLAFIGSLQPDSRPLWDYPLDAPQQDKNHIIMIGPEGDFTPAEYGLARSSGFSPLSLGPLVLRCDTAAVYALSTLSYELRRKTASGKN